MYPDLKNKVALITGATKGIGRGIAEKYASLGMSLVLNYSSDESAARELEQVMQKYDVDYLLVKANVSDVSDIHDLYQNAISHFGRLDVVVANAGIELVQTPFLESTEQQFDKVYNLNVKGSFFVMQEAAKHVVDGGKIILISSTISIHPEEGASIYSSSKAAGKVLVEVLAKELGHRKITVNSIMPGVIDQAGVITNLPEEIKNIMREASPLKRLGTAEDIARVAAFLASSESMYINAHHIAVNGGSAF
ncbi:SDR family oxidoreductase [Marinoscillum luteum]|uniref:SDR family oxidoreductase n=1 Tax=Marinoscillum luteum TaxID=861051 RepID=A0ABW7N7J3_9BACT